MNPAPACACPEADRSSGPTRRSVLRQLAAAGALGTAITVSGGPASSTRYAFGSPVAAASDGGYSGDVLVLLSLRGGFDGLQAIVPGGDPGYRAARPNVGIPQSALLPAGGIFGLHPSLAPLKPWWDAGSFGAVHAVGQPRPTRSHFQAMEELERAAPGSSMRTGWLDRTVGERAAGSVFQATQVGSNQVAPALIGPNPELSMRGIDGFDLSGAWDATELQRWTRALTDLHAGARSTIGVPAAAALGAMTTTAALAEDPPEPGSGGYPEGVLGDALRDVARLIRADVGLQIACVDEGDWDMHAGMGSPDDGWLRDKLDELARALAAFAADLGPALDGVTLVTLSEFGRRVEENGSGGTDHGHGNAVLLLGGGVRGGTVHGAWPGLAADDLVDGDLAGVVDYRLVLGEILQKRCGVGSLAAVFPGLSGTPVGVVTSRP